MNWKKLWEEEEKNFSDGERENMGFDFFDLDRFREGGKKTTDEQWELIGLCGELTDSNGR
jgi:hypothetical protein